MSNSTRILATGIGAKPDRRSPLPAREAWTLIALVAALILVGCAARPSPQAPPAATPTAEREIERCELTPVVVPTRPAETPGYAELDPTTGLHITGTAPEIDLNSYRLEVTGQVENPLSLTYDDLRCMQKVELPCTLVCPGLFQDEATWAGVPLTDVLALAGLKEDAAGLRLVGADGYIRLVSMDMATTGGAFLAYEWEGEPLPILHGFPVRAVFPEHSGGFWTKWLVRIDVISSDPSSGPDILDEDERP